MKPTILTELRKTDGINGISDGWQATELRRQGRSQTPAEGLKFGNEGGDFLSNRTAVGFPRKSNHLAPLRSSGKTRTRSFDCGSGSPVNSTNITGSPSRQDDRTFF